MRLLIQDRGGDEAAVAEIRRTIEWCQADGFWRCNILSPGKLRAKFTQLVLKATPGASVHLIGRESPSDLLRAINGGAA